MTNSQNPQPEIVLQLRIKHSHSDQKWRIVLEGPTKQRVGFDDLCELMRYLKAISQSDISRGLR